MRFLNDESRSAENCREICWKPPYLSIGQPLRYGRDRPGTRISRSYVCDNHVADILHKFDLNYLALTVAVARAGLHDGSMGPTTGPRWEDTAMNETSDDRWISRQELADRYGLPVKTPAEWASKGTGPPYAKFGRHVRYRLSDVVAWEMEQLAFNRRDSA